MKLLLVGNYGVQNLGDEALRESVVRGFPEHSWTIVSARPAAPNEVPRLPCGVRSFFRPWWRTVRAYIRADAVVFGGGSLFTDHESIVAPYLWWVHAMMARVLRKPLLLSFQGVGPLTTPLGLFFARSVIEHAGYVSVRDPASFARILSWNMQTEPVLSFDPALTLFAEQVPAPTPGKLVLIPRSNTTDAFIQAATEEMQGTWEEISILLMHATEEDRQAADRLKRVARHHAVTVQEPETVSEFLKAISSASFVLSQRFHGALAALAMGIPYRVLPQVPGDKLSMLADPGEREELLRLVEEGMRTLKESLDQIGGAASPVVQE
ncbi:MAG: polysaccharide pyruvyl transferase family protein [Candidatus Peribacteraceae bacterium]